MSPATLDRFLSLVPFSGRSLQGRSPDRSRPRATTRPQSGVSSGLILHQGQYSGIREPSLSRGDNLVTYYPLAYTPVRILDL